MDMRAESESWLRRCGRVLGASLFLLAFYWRGLDCWFFQDDFGWLHLGPASGLRDFFGILFAPKAHGNLRPWSENLFFYGLHALFGVNPLPFRIVVFATVIADLFLLDRLVRKLTGSALAAWRVTTWNLERSHVSRDLVLGVVEYRRAHPGKTLLLTGMSTEQFVAGFADLPFELYGMNNVFLAPGADSEIHDGARLAPLYVLPPEKAWPLVDSGQAAVLGVAGGRIRDVTLRPRPPFASPPR